MASTFNWTQSILELKLDLELDSDSGLGLSLGLDLGSGIRIGTCIMKWQLVGIFGNGIGRKTMCPDATHLDNNNISQISAKSAKQIV